MYFLFVFLSLYLSLSHHNMIAQHNTTHRLRLQHERTTMHHMKLHYITFSPSYLFPSIPFRLSIPLLNLLTPSFSPFFIPSFILFPFPFLLSLFTPSSFDLPAQALIPGNLPSSSLTSSELEKDHVFRVYDNIAVHWNHTRGKRKVM